MLDKETLDTLDGLTAYYLHSVEIDHLPKLTREEEEGLVTLARQGNRNALEQLMLVCLLPIYKVLYRRFPTYQPKHEEFMDLCQIAYEEVVREAKTALTKNHPVRYMISCGLSEVAHYLFLHGGMITLPTHRQRREKAQFTFERLTARLNEIAEAVEIVEAPKWHTLEEFQRDQKQLHDVVQEALTHLTKRQRDDAVKLFRLGETPSTHGRLDSSAKAKLRKALEPFWTQQQSESN